MNEAHDNGIIPWHVGQKNSAFHNELVTQIFPPMSKNVASF